jgi:glycosyltransferase involved in cell wall biosynthesis
VTADAISAAARRDVRLTIGMPVYNNAPTIERALNSLLAQSFTDFRLIVSDDGSNDGTANLCEAYSTRDSRVHVVRQPRNLNYGNFRYVLAEADTPLFMFAAGDDYWHPEFLARTVDALDSNPAAVCAVSQVVFIKEGGGVARATGTRPLMSDPTDNIVQFLAAGDDNSRMYGVFRTDVAKRAFPLRDFFAFDWAFSVGTLREGVHLELPEVMFWRDYTKPERYIEYVRRDARYAIDRLFPLLPLTFDVLGRLRIPKTFAVMRQLLRLNIAFHLSYLRRYHPRAAGVLGSVASAVARAATASRK